MQAVGPESLLQASCLRRCWHDKTDIATVSVIIRAWSFVLGRCWHDQTDIAAVKVMIRAGVVCAGKMLLEVVYTLEVVRTRSSMQILHYFYDNKCIMAYNSL